MQAEKKYNLFGLLTSCAVSCACIVNPDIFTSVAISGTVGGIAGNIAAEHFAKLVNNNSLSFFKRNIRELPPEVSQHVKKALVDSVYLTLENFNKNFVGSKPELNYKYVLENCIKETSNNLNSYSRNEVSESYQELSSVEAILDYFLSILEGVDSNDKYSDFRSAFKMYFPVNISLFFQDIIIKNEIVWKSWNMINLNKQREAITQLATSNAVLWKNLKEFEELTVDNFNDLKSKLSQLIGDAYVESHLQDKVLIICCNTDLVFADEILTSIQSLNGTKFVIDSTSYKVSTFSMLMRKVASTKKNIVLASRDYLASQSLILEGIVEDGNNENLILLKQQNCSLEFSTSNVIEYNAQFPNEIKRVSELLERIIRDNLSVPYKRLEEKNINISSLPYMGISSSLFGRKQELIEIDHSWDDPECRIVALIASGGVGKTALVSRWLERMASRNYFGADKVLAVSFYSQGANSQVTSSDEWLNESLKWLGDKEFLTRSSWDKGTRLGELLNDQKAILVLDGLEPLQEPNGVRLGEIKDLGVYALLRSISKRGNGLCVITSRLQIANTAIEKSSIKQIGLDKISTETGRCILRFTGKRGVVGGDEVFNNVVKRFNNHALTIKLLGEYLYKTPGRSIENVKTDFDLGQIATLSVKECVSVLLFKIEKQLNLEHGIKPIQILNFLAFFDRPFKREVLNFLLTDVEKVEENLYVLSRRNLIQYIEGYIDSHPLIRENYREKIRSTDYKYWLLINRRLFKYYVNIPEHEHPATLSELEPLIMAVQFGCYADMHDKVFTDVYYKRILREDEAYLNITLGAFGTDLSILANFFTKLWDQPSKHLNLENQIECLSFAGFALRGLGKTKECIEPFMTSLATYVENGQWEYAAIESSNISESYLYQGNLQKAIEFGKKSLKCAKKSQLEIEVVFSRTTLAEAYHKSGKIKKAYTQFKKARKLQLIISAGTNDLHSLRGVRYCEFLISTKRYNRAMENAKKGIKLAIENNELLATGLYQIILAKVSWKSASVSKNRHHDIVNDLNAGIDTLRKAGQLQYIPFGLIERAKYNLEFKKHDKLYQDMEEIYDIAFSGEMWLYLIDYLILFFTWKYRVEEEVADEVIWLVEKTLNKTERAYRSNELNELLR